MSALETALEKIQKSKNLVVSATKTALIFPEDLQASPYYMIFTPIKYSKVSALGVKGLELIDAPEERSKTASNEETFDRFGSVLAGANRGASPSSPTTKVKFESGQLIALPLPSQLSDNLSISFGATDMGITAAGFQAGQSIGKLDFGVDEALGSTGYAVRTLAQLSEGVSAALNLLTGNVPNPYSVLTFKSVEQRTFDFDWTFVPRNEKESRMLRDIINTIRYLALPEQNGLFLEFPYEWEVQFVGTKFLHSFSRGYITDLKIEYGSSGGISFFPLDNDGAPSQIKFSFSFREIYPLNKTLITSDNEAMYPSENFINAQRTREAALEPLQIVENKLLEEIENEKIRQEAWRRIGTSIGGVT